MLLCKTYNLFDTSFSALSLTISVFGPKQFSYCLKKKAYFFSWSYVFLLLETREKEKNQPTTISTDLQICGF